MKSILAKKVTKILHFPLEASMHYRKFKNRRHWGQGQEISENVVLQFIRALTQNNFAQVIQLVEQHGDHLVTVHGNYFALPLHIAGQHANMGLINYLLEKGADPYMAIHHPRFQYLFFKVQRYFKAICHFKHQVFNNLD